MKYPTIASKKISSTVDPPESGQDGRRPAAATAGVGVEPAEEAARPVRRVNE